MSIYLIRHAQSEFNAAYEPGKPDPMLFDTRLSKLGEQQAASAQLAVRDLDISNVIVSPLRRTLQTASIIFGKTQPMKINAIVREQLLNSGDVGRPPQELSEDYPHLDFDHLDECWWHDGERDHRGICVEPHSVLLQRTEKFAEIAKRENWRSTAIVTHGNFIHALTGIQPDNCQIIEFN